MAVEQFVNMVRASCQQSTFFHFTDASNVDSIRANGLLSMREIRKRQLVHTPGGNQLSQDLDIHHGMDAYVHLCFRRQHGMAHRATQDGRISDLRWLDISPDVLSISGILVTLDNAVKNDTPAIPLEEAINRIDVEVLYTRTDWHDADIQARMKRVERYELLIPNGVPPAYIR
jgi:hypothetical protein